jgi:AAA domain
LVDLESPPDPLREWNIVSVRELSEPLGPVPWLCESLRLAPGPVALFAGYGYSRKTLALQSLGLSVAMGAQAWGVFSCSSGMFVHLDYEQGRRLTQERYQRLARGMGRELRELDDKDMRVCIMPSVYLDHADVESKLMALCDGAKFVIVDSLRAAFPGADENSSDVRKYLDALSRVAERTGAVIAVIHHARKPDTNKGGSVTHAIRGSSALFDACQSIFVFEGEKGSPTRVHHMKERVRGLELESFGLTSEDVYDSAGVQSDWGLRVTHLEPEQLAETERASTMLVRKRGTAIAIKEIERFFLEKSGVLTMSRDEIKRALGVSTAGFDAAWGLLRTDGRLVRDLDGRWQLNSLVPITLEP